ncbi:MAG: MerC domain-containing protein [Acidobacteriota bacterium]
MVVSTLCVLHCVSLPIVLAMFPLTSVHWMTGEAAEWVLLVSAVAIALLSLGLGYRRHRSRSVLLLFASGLLLLVGSHVTTHETALTAGRWWMIAAGVLIVVAHGLNHALCDSRPACADAADIA